MVRSLFFSGLRSLQRMCKFALGNIRTIEVYRFSHLAPGI